MTGRNGPYGLIGGILGVILGSLVYGRDTRGFWRVIFGLQTGLLGVLGLLARMAQVAMGSDGTLLYAKDNRGFLEVKNGHFGHFRGFWVTRGYRDSRRFGPFWSKKGIFGFLGLFSPISRGRPWRTCFGPIFDPWGMPG